MPRRQRQYEISGILEQKTEGERRYFLVSWKGYGPAANEWVAESEMNCEDLMAEFLARSSGGEHPSEHSGECQLPKREHSHEQSSAQRNRSIATR